MSTDVQAPAPAPALSFPRPPEPLPADTYPARHRVWWEQCDVLIRAAQVAEMQAFRTGFEQNFGPTLDALAAAWDKLDDKLGALAAALAAPAPARLPTRAELTFAILRDHPQATILTNSQLVNGAAGIVDAFAARYPEGVAK